jgi:tetratricopeptide (TPR) repeat protein
MPLPNSEKRRGEPSNIQGLLANLDSYTELLGRYDPQTLAVVHNLAIALWCAGDIDGAVGILDQALDHTTSRLEREHPVRIDLLSTLGEIMFEQRHLEQAGVILREVLECRVRQAGANHPDSLAAKSDLAAVLLDLGHDDEAGSLEREAFDSARTHLGRTHSVTCVLAWNRALSLERCGDPDSARMVFASELVWLLAEDPSRLETDQKTIRTMLAERLNWDAAKAC